MSTRKIFSIICLCLTVLLVICVFLPFVQSSEISYSLWKYLDLSGTTATAILIIIELLIAIVAYILQLAGASKDAKLAYLGLGYYTSYHLSLFMTAISKSAMDELAFGFWLGFIISLTTVILTFIGSFLSNERKPKYYGYGAPIQTGFDPYTGEPIYKQ